MVAVLDDPALIEHQYPIERAYRRKPVGNNDRPATKSAVGGEC